MGVIEELVIREVRGSPFVGIGLDEPTDRSSEKHLAFIMRYISSMSNMKTCFIECVKVHDSRATTVCHTLDDTAHKYAISLTKLVDLGTDGAFVIASNFNGVNGLVRNDNPHIVFVHCVCHPVYLCVSQACARIADIVALQAIINAEYSFVQLNLNRLCRFREMATVLGREVLKFKRLIDIRWLRLVNSVAAVMKNFAPLMLMIQEDAAAGDPTAIGLSKYVNF